MPRLPKVLLISLVAAIASTSVAMAASTGNKYTPISGSVSFDGVAPTGGEITLAVGKPIVVRAIATDMDDLDGAKVEDGVCCDWAGLTTGAKTYANDGGRSGDYVSSTTSYTWTALGDYTVIATLNDCSPPGSFTHDDPVEVTTTVHVVPDSVAVSFAPLALFRDGKATATATIAVKGYGGGAITGAAQVHAVLSSTLAFGDGSAEVDATTNPVGIATIAVHSPGWSSSDGSGTLTATCKGISGSGQLALLASARIRTYVSNDGGTTWEERSVGCSGSTIFRFYADQYDPDITKASPLVWKVDGADSGTARVLQHTFSTPGTHTVRLDVDDYFACWRSVNVTVQ